MKKQSIFDEIKRCYEIDRAQATDLFNNGIVIYIQAEDTKYAPECHNTFMLSNKVWDGSLNIFKGGATPEQYGFDNIMNWIGERTNNVPKFFTYFSTEFLNIDNN